MPRFSQFVLTIAALIGSVSATAALAQQAQPGQPADATPVDTTAIQVIKESNPTTTLELVLAILQANDLERPDVSKAYLQKLISKNPDIDDVLAAERKLGGGKFLELQTQSSLQPEGAQAATMLMKKLEEHYRSPNQLQKLIGQLNDPNLVVRKRAVQGILNAGPAAAKPLFDVLADPAQKPLQPAVTKVLLMLDREIHGPLLAALDSSNPRLVAPLVDIAKRLHLSSALDFVVGQYVLTDDAELRSSIGEYLDSSDLGRPSQDEVAAYLKTRIDAYLGGDLLYPINENGMVETWTWDAEKGEPVVNPLEPDVADVVIAGQLLHQLRALKPDDRDVIELSALLAMQRMASVGQSDAELKEIVQKDGIDIVAAALKRALQQRKFAQAAIVACQQLGATKDVGQLLAIDGIPSPLAQALQSPVYRVRRAAVKAITEIDPKAPYAGSAEFLDMLVFMTSAQGKRIVVIGELEQKRAQNMAGVLTQLRFEPIITGGGADMFKAASSSADVEVVFISKPLLQPAMMESVQVLRKDRRTGDLPIGLVSPIDEVPYYQLQTDEDPLTHVMIRPNDTEAFIHQLKKMYRSQGPLLVSAAERSADAEFAVQQLLQMMDNSDQYDFYNFLKLEEMSIRRLEDENVAGNMAKILGRLATPAAQTSLVDYASDPLHPIALRTACATAFEKAIGKRGILLTKEQILGQYDRYNASEKLDSETQALLSRILDIIEAPTKDVRFDQPAKIGS
ncbi:hypothetical protein GC197_11910 [bacterium]|nr:hypothetical protein [bacterium]